MKKAEFGKAKARMREYLEKYGYATDIVIGFVTAFADEKENERTWTDSQLEELFDMAAEARKKS